MQQEKLVTQKIIQEALDILSGAVTIVYPMGLPPHDVIRQEFENTEDLSGTQASLEVYLTFYSDLFSARSALYGDSGRAKRQSTVSNLIEILKVEKIEMRK